jgi:hypothetical protein
VRSVEGLGVFVQFVYSVNARCLQHKHLICNQEVVGSEPTVGSIYTMVYSHRAAS